MKKITKIALYVIAITLCQTFILECSAEEIDPGNPFQDIVPGSGYSSLTQSYIKGISSGYVKVFDDTLFLKNWQPVEKGAKLRQVTGNSSFEDSLKASAYGLKTDSEAGIPGIAKVSLKTSTSYATKHTQSIFNATTTASEQMTGKTYIQIEGKKEYIFEAMLDEMKELMRVARGIPPNVKKKLGRTNKTPTKYEQIAALEQFYIEFGDSFVSTVYLLQNAYCKLELDVSKSSDMSKFSFSSEVGVSGAFEEVTASGKVSVSYQHLTEENKKDCTFSSFAYYMPGTVEDELIKKLEELWDGKSVEELLNTKDAMIPSTTNLLAASPPTNKTPLSRSAQRQNSEQQLQTATRPSPQSGSTTEGINWEQVTNTYAVVGAGLTRWDDVFTELKSVENSLKNRNEKYLKDIITLYADYVKAVSITYNAALIEKEYPLREMTGLDMKDLEVVMVQSHGQIFLNNIQKELVRYLDQSTEQTSAKGKDEFEITEDDYKHYLEFISNNLNNEMELGGAVKYIETLVKSFKQENSIFNFNGVNGFMLFFEYEGENQPYCLLTNDYPDATKDSFALVAKLQSANISAWIDQFTNGNILKEANLWFPLMTINNQFEETAVDFANYLNIPPAPNEPLSIGISTMSTARKQASNTMRFNVVAKSSKYPNAYQIQPLNPLYAEIINNNTIKPFTITNDNVFKILPLETESLLITPPSTLEGKKAITLYCIPVKYEPKTYEDGQTPSSSELSQNYLPSLWTEIPSGIINSLKTNDGSPKVQKKDPRSL